MCDYLIGLIGQALARDPDMAAFADDPHPLRTTVTQMGAAAVHITAPPDYAGTVRLFLLPDGTVSVLGERSGTCQNGLRGEDEIVTVVVRTLQAEFEAGNKALQDAIRAVDLRVTK